MVSSQLRRDEPPDHNPLAWWSAKPNLDPVGIFWISFASVWTVLVASGMLFLWRNRKMPFLRMRGLPLSFAAVTLLHLYWFAVQLVYTIGGMFPNGLEFWIMSIWLPFGVALFHASNARFLYVAKGQERFARPATVSFASTEKGSEKGFFGGAWRRDYSKRILTFVSVGMVFQFFVSLTMYLLSRKFHPSFGIPGTETTGPPQEQIRQRLQGWEWWPSIFWQCFWAWIVAPVILWRAHNIYDTQGWRVQTIACCLANLHAAPMWVVALRVPEMAPVNKYFAPPQWIAVSIFLLEIFTIFLPCIKVLRHQSLRQETLDTIAAWENKTKAAAVAGGGGATSLQSGPSGTARSGQARAGADGRTPPASWRSLSIMERGNSFDNASSKSVLMMEALEFTLEQNPEPLQKFSALQDFSGENIAFLTSVAAWKAALPPFLRAKGALRSSGDSLSESDVEAAREHFELALRIYTEYVSALDAEFPVNLASDELKRLERVFEGAARSLYGGKRLVDPGTPFETVVVTSIPTPGTPNSRMSEKPIFLHDVASSLRAGSSEVGGLDKSGIAGPGYAGEIPQAFDGAVFDAAVASIKYLVLTNTWPKFVKEKRSSASLDRASQESLVEAIGSKCRAIGRSIAGSARTR